MELSHTRRSGSGRPRNIDLRQDRRIVRAAAAAGIAPREEIGHMFSFFVANGYIYIYEGIKAKVV